MTEPQKNKRGISTVACVTLIGQEPPTCKRRASRRVKDTQPRPAISSGGDGDTSPRLNFYLQGLTYEASFSEIVSSSKARLERERSAVPYIRGTDDV